MTRDLRRFWQTKTFWAAIVAILGVIATAWSFAFAASPIAKAILATLTGIAGILEGLFIADRVTRISGSRPSHSPRA